MFWKTDDLMIENTTDSDTETLQTDIQRFIAILGFCLMAIFALVQSISVTSARERTQIEDLGQKIEAQQADLQELAEENHRLQIWIAALQPHVAASEKLRKRLDLLRKQLNRQEIEARRLIDRKIDAEKDLVTLTHAIRERDLQIRRLEQEKAQAEKSLADVHARLQDTGQLQMEIEGLKKRLAQASLADRELAEIKAEKARLERLLAATPPVRQPAPPPKETSMAASAPPRRGRYVAFESDRVFMNLLAADRISLFIKVEGVEKWFRARNANPGVSFSTAVPEAAMDPWEVGEDLVPAEIISAFKQWTSLAPKTEMLVVGLPPEISSPIRRRGNVHGRFIISDGGGVTFNRFEE